MVLQSPPDLHQLTCTSIYKDSFGLSHHICHLVHANHSPHCHQSKGSKKACLPVTPKVLLLWRYLTVAMVRVGCMVAGVGAIIGVVGMMNHYHAEKVPLNSEIWSRNNPDSKLELCVWRVVWKLWYLLMPDKFQKLCASLHVNFQIMSNVEL